MSEHFKPTHPTDDADPALTEAFEAALLYTETTRALTVTAKVFVLDDQTHPEHHQYAWAYHICIKNGSEEKVQLVSRSWEITDGRGKTEHVYGDGVVGEQPIINPGETLEYTSGATLTTESGFMRGTYQMVNLASGDRFDIRIPAFSLSNPRLMGFLH